MLFAHYFVLFAAILFVGGYAVVQAIRDMRRRSYLMLAWGLVIAGFSAFILFSALDFTING